MVSFPSLHRNRGALEGKRELDVKFESSFPVVTVLAHPGAFCFDSESAFEIFKSRRGLEYAALDADGNGTPALYITDTTEKLGTLGGNAPVYVISRFVVLEAGSAPPADHELQAERNGRRLFRVPLCEVYRRTELRRTDYRFLFSGRQQGTRSETLSATRFGGTLNAAIDGVPLQWTVGNSVINDRDDYSLRASPDRSSAANAAPAAPAPRRPDSVLALYTRANRDPRVSKLFRQATIYVGGKSRGAVLRFSPWNTELVACQALLIHYLEYHKREKRARKGKNSQVAFFGGVLNWGFFV